MNSNINYSLIIILLTSLALVSKGQSQVTTKDTVITRSVQAIAKRSNNLVNLRWAPDAADAWLLANKYGYKIERLEIDTRGELIIESKKTLVDSLRPLDKYQWMAEAEKGSVNDYYLAALETIHGPWQSNLSEDFLFYVIRDSELRNKYSFCLLSADLDQGAALASGLAYIDNTVATGKAYLYAVKLNIPTKYGFQLIPGQAVAPTGSSPKPPAFPIAGIEGDSIITLKWDREIADQFYSAYHVERSDNFQNFKRITSKPLINGFSKDNLPSNLQHSFIDSVQRYLPVRYRIIGIDAFGEEGVPAETKVLMSRDLTPPEAPRDLLAEQLKERSIILTWTAVNCKDHNGFDLYRSIKAQGPYSKVNKDRIPANKRTFTDNNFAYSVGNYYKVVAIDTAQNEASSYPYFATIIDSIPPGIPTGLKGSCDSLGRVNLSWERNPEVDLLGYKVQFANAIDHEFSNLTGQAISGTNFIDTIALNTTTEAVYYRIFAVDKMYNYSEMSEVLKVMRPDTIKPDAPLFTNYEVSKDKVELNWQPSSSKDAVQQELWRKFENEKWNLIASFDNNSNEYSDNSFDKLGTHTYKLVSIDKNGNKANCPENLSIKNIPKLTRPGFQTWKLSNESNKALLTWTATSADIKYIHIFKSTNDGGFDQIKTLTPDNNSYLDKQVREGRQYSYTAQLKYTDGSSSEFAQIKSFTFKSD